MTYENQTFSDQHVSIDGNQFTGCTFTRCFLSYSGGPFSLENCQLDENRIEFHGAALQTIWFLKTFGWVLPPGLDVIERPSS